MTTLKQAMTSQFGSAAEAYRTSSVHAGGEDLKRLVQAARLTGVERVLDAGCGAGHAAAAVAPHAREVLAVDLTAAMLEVTRGLAAERGLHNLTVRQGDVEALPVHDGEFDVVVSRYSAHHWPHPQRALSEIRRALTRGGRFVLADIVTWDDPTLDTWLQALELIRDPSHVRDHSIQQWLDLLNQAGFSAVVDFEFSVRLDFDAWVERIGTPAGQVQSLRVLMADAPAEVRSALRIEPEGHFTLRGAIFSATRIDAD